MPPNMLDERPIQYLPFLDRCMPSPLPIPNPAARKRNSLHFTPSLQSPMKRLKVANGLNEAGSTPQFKAETWFNDTNKDASGMNDVSFQDNDPPFYVCRRPSSDGNSICAAPSDRSDSSNLGLPTAPTRSLLARMDSSRSNSEDFRSVIDDLTIQNKKLKKRLRKYEKLHCSHLQEKKLFEVRIHGLSAHRKRELEETLRKFASTIEEESPEMPSIAPLPLKRSTLADSPLRKPSLSSALCSKPSDSAYASMSGQTGLSHSQIQDQNITEKLGHSRQENVKSYLHDMSQTFMPKHSLAMSDRSKSKLVVKWLEQIFTGKGAASRRHNQSHQQQEVSRSAAHADRNKMEARGRRAIREGVREAHILPTDMELQVDTISEADVAAQQCHKDGETSQTRSTQPSRDGGPEQRPTRPLDLDLRRAQVASDNIEYIRHLGLAPRSNDLDSEVDGWVFLNLLTGMAQLHTLNVTPEFIRHAIVEVSDKFELSADRTKVRWQGGREGTRMSSDSDESEDVAKSTSVATSFSQSKRGSTADLSNAADARQESNSGVPPESSVTPEVGKRRPVPLGQSILGGKFHYKPLFFHGTPTDTDDSIPASASSSDVLENGTVMNSGMNSGSHGLREAEAKLRRHNISENGPIIFYHKAMFCTDLSGDPSATMIDEGAYRRFTQQPVGCQSDSPSDAGHDTLSNASIIPNDPMEYDLNSVQSRSLLDLDELKSCISDCAASSHSASSPAPVDMQVSGLGGIQPDDNFVVKVRVRHSKQKPGQSSAVSSFSSPRRAGRLLHNLVKGAVKAFHEREIPRSQPPLNSEIVLTVKTDMAPSSLPPPSFLCIPFSPSDTDDLEGVSKDLGVGVSVSPSLYPRGRRLQAYHPTFMEDDFGSMPTDIFINSSSEESKASSHVSTTSGSGSDDSSSIDLLAHARVLDPDSIAAQEREFDDIAVYNGIKPLNHPPASSSAVSTSDESRDNVSQGSGFQMATRQGESDVDSMSVDGDDGSARRMSR